MSDLAKWALFLGGIVALVLVYSIPAPQQFYGLQKLVLAVGLGCVLGPIVVDIRNRMG